MARAIGLDIGTSSISCVVVEESRGVIASRTVANDASSRSARSDERLQDPVRLLDLVDDAVEWASRDHPGSAALGLTGQQHGAVYLDQALHPVSPLITWQDGRGWRLFNHPAGPSDRERNAADTDHSFVGQLEDVTGYHMASGYGLTTHFVLLHAGAVPAGASCLATIADLAVARLAGLDRPVCHPSMAASLGLYDLPGQRFDLKALANAKIDPAILPTVSNNERPLGEYRGLAIVPAIGDNQASYLGAAGMAGGLLINIGTGSQISLTSGATIRTVDGLETRPHVAGNYLLVGSALCGGAAYRQLCDFFAACAGLAGARVDGPDLYEAATQAALAAMTAANGPAPLRVDTRFQGTRTEPDRRGTISGIGPDNLTPSALAAGVVTGLVGELAELGQRAEAVIGPSERLIGSGNAVRKNPAIRLAIERAFGRTPMVPVRDEEAAAGAAMFALWAAGLTSFEEISRSIAYEAQLRK